LLTQHKNSISNTATFSSVPLSLPSCLLIFWLPTTQLGAARIQVLPSYKAPRKSVREQNKVLNNPNLFRGHAKDRRKKQWKKKNTSDLEKGGQALVCWLWQQETLLKSHQEGACSADQHW